ncbi:hypothetical protein OAD67_03530 [bacterium]|nr:hypothetical protein [bacterium]MDC1215442.1 hypothetical protein [bacterium]
MGIASRCRRCCAAIETIGDGFLRHVGPCYVMLGCGLVSMVAYSLLYIVLPLTKDLHTWFGLGTFIAVAFVFFNIGFNYLMSVRVAPGSPTTREVQVLCAEAGAAVRYPVGELRLPEFSNHTSPDRVSIPTPTRPPGTKVVPDLPVPEARPNASLFHMQEVRAENGPSLSLDPQLRRAQELPVFF